MKLRNKNTGGIGEGHIYFTIEGKVEVSYMAYSNTNGHCVVNISYDSIAELSENFEIVKKTEPLIKDEKIRKAVRAWAEANDFIRVFYEYDYSNDVAVFMVGESKMTIESDELLDDSRNYTIAELCGEEEE